MWFYALLKGCPRHAVEKELAQMLDAVGLPHKRDSTADTLSGENKFSFQNVYVKQMDSNYVFLY